MIRRLMTTPINKTLRMWIRLTAILIVGLLIVGNHQGFIVPISGWIEMHIPKWAANADVIIVSLFPITLELPISSEASYLAIVMFSPFILIYEPCDRKALSYMSAVAWISFLYFAIRSGLFYDSIPRLKEPDDWDWEQIRESMSHSTVS